MGAGAAPTDPLMLNRSVRHLHFEQRTIIIIFKKLFHIASFDLEERVAAFPLPAAPPPPPKTGTPLCVRKAESDEVEGPLRTNVSKSRRS